MTGEMRVRELPRTVSSPFSTNSGGALRKRGVTVRTATSRAAAAPARAHCRGVKNAAALSNQAAFLASMAGRSSATNTDLSRFRTPTISSRSASLAKQGPQLK